MVLVILAMVWAAVLGPGLLRRQAERRSSDSIGAFHRQLRVLGRTGPVIVDPAHTLRTDAPESTGLFRMAGSRGRHLSRPSDIGVLEHHGARRPDPYFRPEACKRRRDIMASLLCSVVGTGLLGAIPALRPMLYVTIAASVALASYIALLVHLRNLALEREIKLRYLPTPVGHESAVVVQRAAVR